jgi:hypothetical protein
MLTAKTAVAALDRVALNDVLNRRVLLTLRFLGRGSAGVIVEELLFLHLTSKTRTARSNAVRAVCERVEVYKAWCRAINRLSRELTHNFAIEDGSVDWRRLLHDG